MKLSDSHIEWLTVEIIYIYISLEYFAIILNHLVLYLLFVVLLTTYNPER